MELLIDLIVAYLNSGALESGEQFDSQKDGILAEIYHNTAKGASVTILSMPLLIDKKVAFHSGFPKHLKGSFIKMFQDLDFEVNILNPPSKEKKAFLG